ncbi:MAG: glycosyltransferase family A protein [Patescibacteria group bacterium]
MSEPTLAIVIPTKNEEKFIGNLLQSIVEQKEVVISQIPIFIADADSTDRTKEVIKTFSDKLNIKIIPGGKVAHARNNGLKEAKTEYVLFSDADNVFDPFLISKLKDRIASGKLAYTPLFKPQTANFNTEILWKFTNFLLKRKLVGGFLCGMAHCLNREQIIKLGGYNEEVTFGEDFELGRRVGARNIEVVDSYAYISNRRFDRDGFWNVFLPWAKAFISSLFNKKTLITSNKDYFKDDFSAE